MQIAEPMTMLTDYLLAGWTAFLAWRLLGMARQTSSRAQRWWGWAFIGSAVAAATGGSYHGLAPVFPAGALLFLWKVTVYAVGLAGFCLLIASALATLKRSARKWLFFAATLKFILYAVWMLWHESFFYVVLDYLPSLVVVLVLFSWRFLQSKEKSGAWVASGILISFIAAGIQQSGLPLHRHFNHNDLYHLVQMVGFYFLYRGGLLLQER